MTDQFIFLNNSLKEIHLPDECQNLYIPEKPKINILEYNKGIYDDVLVETNYRRYNFYNLRKEKVVFFVKDGDDLTILEEKWEFINCFISFISQNVI